MTRRRMSTLGMLIVCGSLSGCGDDKNFELTESVETSDPSFPHTDTGGTTYDSSMSSGDPVTSIDPGTSGGPTLSTGDESFTGDVFISPMDGGSGTVECNVWTQNCPPGEKCTAWADDGGSSWNATKCVPVLENPKQPGEPCMVTDSGVSGLDDCELGSMCWDVGEELMGTCVAQCTGSEMEPMCQDPATVCAIYNEGVLNLCLDRCDPLTGDCPDPNDLCLPASLEDPDGFLCIVDASGDGGQVHTPCTFANSCDAGLLCRPAASASECDQQAGSCCEPVCDLTVPDPDSQCTGVGQKCVAFFMPDMAPEGDEDVGVCAVPM